MSELKGNKGEWSEIYAHLKLLADGVLYAGDRSLNKLVNVFFPIIEIPRKNCVYSVNQAKKLIKIETNSKEFEIPQAKFMEMAQSLLILIKKAEKGSLQFPKIEDFLHTIEIHELKAKSSEKKDIRIVMHDLRTGTTPELGFSIKSQLGSDSTLFNANKNGTNFLFQVRNCNSTIVEDFNKQETFVSKCEILQKNQCVIEFIDVINEDFRNNLTFIDSMFSKILAECLFVYYSKQVHTSLLNDILNFVIERNPLQFSQSISSDVYKFKMKQFLLAIALGMTANKKWNGIHEANGGYIIVKEDGDIVCYHYYNQDQLGDYLLENTYFDTPSTNRHDFGKIEKGKNGDYLLKLNIQIRFKHKRK